MSVPFTGSSLYLPFTAVVDLENNQTYGYKIVRDNDKWYKNDADNTMTVDNHKNWPFIEDNSNGLACGIQTVAAGNYTFTLTLNATTGNLEVSVDYPVTVVFSIRIILVAPTSHLKSSRQTKPIQLLVTSSAQATVQNSKFKPQHACLMKV